jgi:hypothetical protein
MCSVLDLSKTRLMACPRCKATMDPVVRIAPVAGEPGLIAYECPTCSYVTSILWQPKEPRKNPDAPAVEREAEEDWGKKKWR